MVQHSGDGITIRAATLADAAGVVAIYNHFVLQSIVTFEEQPIDSAEMSRRFESVWQSSLPWLVAEQHGALLG